MGPAFIIVLKIANPIATTAMLASGGGGAPGGGGGPGATVARMQSASAIPAKPAICSGTRPTRSTSRIAIANPIGRKMSSAAVALVEVMSSAMKVVLAPCTAIAAISVGVKMPTP